MTQILPEKSWNETQWVECLPGTHKALSWSRVLYKLDSVACNPNTQEVEAGNENLHSEFQASLGYTLSQEYKEAATMLFKARNWVKAIKSNCPLRGHGVARMKMLKRLWMRKLKSTIQWTVGTPCSADGA